MQTITRIYIFMALCTLYTHQTIAQDTVMATPQQKNLATQAREFAEQARKAVKKGLETIKQKVQAIQNKPSSPKIPPRVTVKAKPEQTPDINVFRDESRFTQPAQAIPSEVVSKPQVPQEPVVPAIPQAPPLIPQAPPIPTAPPMAPSAKTTPPMQQQNPDLLKNIRGGVTLKPTTKTSSSTDTGLSLEQRAVVARRGAIKGNDEDEESDERDDQFGPSEEPVIAQEKNTLINPVAAPRSKDITSGKVVTPHTPITGEDDVVRARQKAFEKQQAAEQDWQD